MGRRDRWEPVSRRQRPAWRQWEQVSPLPLDVYSTSEELVIQAAVPGANPQDVEITISGEALTIRAECAGPLENVDYHVQERSFGSFSRTLNLNIPVEADEAEAVFEKGVLTLTIPKAKEARPRIIKVKGA